MVNETATSRAFVLAIEAQTADANLARFRRELDHVRQTGTNQEYSRLLIRVLRLCLERNAQVVAA